MLLEHWFTVVDVEVRPITPPPESPPHQRSQGRSRTSRHSVRTEVESGISVATSSHIEHTVAQVAEEAAEYARRHEVDRCFVALYLVGTEEVEVLFSQEWHSEERDC